MTRKRTSTSQASAVALLSAGVLMASSASAQAPKSPAPTTKAPAAAQPMPFSASPVAAAKVDRGSAHIKFANSFLKWRDSLSVAGLMNGSPVFKTPQGEFFQVEPNTGDLKWMSSESLGYIKVHGMASNADAGKGAARAAGQQSIFIKFDGIKGESKVTVLGVDDQGHVIQQNARGEKFYLSATGDMVFAK